MTKFLLIGLDGAPYALVRRWSEEGKLPNISRLMANGAHGELFSPLDVTPPAWSSIYTGKNPGKHSVYDFARRRPGTYDFAFANSTTRRSADVWEILSRAGMKVCVLNAPLTYPVREVNGVMASGFLTPRFATDYTYPPSLRSEIEGVSPGFRPSSPGVLVQRLSRKAYLRGLSRRLEALARTAEHLMKRDSYDFVAVVVSETDFVQHWYWREMESGRGPHRDAILNVYQVVDRMVGDLVKAAGEGAYAMLVSDHGGAPRRDVFHTNGFLHSVGALRFRPALASRLRVSLWKGGLVPRLTNFLLKRNIFFLKLLMNPLLLSTADVDFGRSRAYSEGYGQIYFNVAGREPSGVLRPEESGAYADRLIAKLRELPPGDPGRHIDRIFKKGEIFSGPYLDDAPEIQFTMADGYEADTQFLEGAERSGTHNHFGTLLLSGPGVAKGELEGAAVTDVAPTILGVLGVPIPRDMDGRFLEGAFTPAQAKSFSVRASEQEQESGSAAYEFSKADEEALERNLRSLGYV